MNIVLDNLVLLPHLQHQLLNMLLQELKLLLYTGGAYCKGFALKILILLRDSVNVFLRCGEI